MNRAEDPRLDPDQALGEESHGQDAVRAFDEQAMLDEIDAEIAAERAGRRRAPLRMTGGVLLGAGALGWLASLMLLIDKLFLLANPGAGLACDINPLISCGTVMMTWQANAFGIPNMALGLSGFAIMAATGALWLSGTSLPHWFRLAQLGGAAFAFGFVHFLAISAMFVIRALCPWCLVVWIAAAPLFFVSLARAIEDRDLPLGGGLARALCSWVVCTVGWYLLVVLVAFLAFRPQWLAMLGIG